MIVPNYLSIAFNSAFNEVGGYEQLVDKYFLAVAENRLEQNQIKHLGNVEPWTWTHKPNVSVNLCYAQSRELLLVKTLEQPIRMLKNEGRLIIC